MYGLNVFMLKSQIPDCEFPSSFYSAKKVIKFKRKFHEELFKRRNSSGKKI
jgi:hypothetical protein